MLACDAERSAEWPVLSVFASVLEQRLSGFLSVRCVLASRGTHRCHSTVSLHQCCTKQHCVLVIGQCQGPHPSLWVTAEP